MLLWERERERQTLIIYLQFIDYLFIAYKDQCFGHTVQVKPIKLIYIELR